MYTAHFDYLRAASVAEAVSLLAARPNARLLAGGHSLIPAMKLRLDEPATLIDIGRIAELQGIASDGDTVQIGALATHARIANADRVPAGLRAAAGQIGDPQVRNRGTIGGSVAHADPAADLPIILAALDAVIHLAGPAGARALAAGEFFHGFFQTARMPAEMVTAVTVPARGASAYAKMPNPASGYCMVGAGVVIQAAGGVCTSARVAVGGLTAAPVRCLSVEAALAGQPLTADTLGAAAGLVDGDLPADLIGDMHADEAYRRAMVPVYLKRALLEARRAV